MKDATATVIDNEAKVLTHPWQDQGLGRAPFNLVAVIVFPGKWLAEANPMAYQTAAIEATRQARGYNVGLCTCDVCGTGLVNNYIIEDASKKHFVVGSDCVAKTCDSKLITVVEAAEKARQKAARNAKAAADHAARQAAWEVEAEAQRERNGGKTDSEIAYENREAEARKARNNRLAVIAARNAWLVEVIDRADKKTDWLEGIISDLRTGEIDSIDMAPKLHSILADVYARVRGPQIKAAGWKKGVDPEWMMHRTAKDVAGTEFGDKYRAAKAAAEGAAQ